MALLDDHDLDLVAALQVSPRAGIGALAEVLGVSASTVSRRLARLTEERLLRVIAQLDWAVLSDTHPFHLWVSARPGAVAGVARAVAALPEAQFAAVVSGSSDVYAILHPSSRADGADLITERVGRIDGATATRMELALRSYASAATWRLERLSDDQVARLATEPGAAAEDAGTPRLGSDELRVAEVLRHDGRASAADVARSVGVSQSTAYRIIQSLLARRVVTPRVEIEPALVGFPLEAVMALTAEPRSVARVAERLGSHPCARFVTTVAGHSSMNFHGAFVDEQHLERFLTADLSDVRGITAVRVGVVMRVLTRYWLSRDGVHVSPATSGMP